MYATAALESASGTIGGKFLVYGLNSTGSTGAELRYSEEREFNPIVPADAVDEMEALKKRLASGELKISVTRKDARGGP
jgi:basic membrane protein A